MKKLTMVLVCLMTMVMSINAQDDMYVMPTSAHIERATGLDDLEQFKKNYDYRYGNNVISGTWKDINSNVSIRFDNDRVVITDKVDSLVIFKKLDKYVDLWRYYCNVKFTGIGKKTVKVKMDYDIFDSNHMTLTIMVCDICLEKKYRLVKVD